MRCATGLADDNAKVQAAAANMLNLALTLPDAPADLSAVLVTSSTQPSAICLQPVSLMLAWQVEGARNIACQCWHVCWDWACSINHKEMKERHANADPQSSSWEICCVRQDLPVLSLLT